MNAGAAGTASANYRIPPIQHRDEAVAALDRLTTAVLGLAERHEDCCGVVNVASLREAVGAALRGEAGR